MAHEIMLKQKEPDIARGKRGITLKDETEDEASTTWDAIEEALADDAEMTEDESEHEAQL
ncbi:hypothetical protein ACLOJK_036617 [Asimina triloba]